MAYNAIQRPILYNAAREKDINEFIDRVTQTVLEYTNRVTMRYDIMANYTFPTLYSKYCHATLIKSLENLDDFYKDLENELRLQRGQIDLLHLVERLKRKIYQGLSMDSGFYAMCGKVIVIKDFLLRKNLSFVGDANNVIFEKARMAFDGCIFSRDYDYYRKCALSLLNAVIETNNENPDLYISNIYTTLDWNEVQLPDLEKRNVQVLMRNFTRNRFQTCPDKRSSMFYRFIATVLLEFQNSADRHEPGVENRLFVELSCLALQYKNYFCPEGVEAVIDFMVKVMVCKNEQRNLDFISSSILVL